MAFTLAVSLYLVALCRSCDIARSNGNRLYGKNYTFKHLLFRHIIWLFKQWYVGPLVIDDVDVDHDGYEFVGGRLKQWKIAVVLLFVIYALHKMHWTDYEHDLCVCCLCVLFVLCVIFCDRTMAFVIFFFYICAFFYNIYCLIVCLVLWNHFVQCCSSALTWFSHICRLSVCVWIN